MGVNTKRIALITGTEATKQELKMQLDSLLKGYVDVISYASDIGISETINANLVVISSKLIIDDVMPYINKKCPIIVARRALNMSKLDKLFSLPEFTDVLLVNDTAKTSMEVIDLLKELGIDHINLIPHYPGCKMDTRTKIAITPGEAMYAPSYVKKIIDIGPRIIDLTTIVEILEKLNLLDEKVHFVSAKYMETIVRLGRQLYKSISETNQTNDYLIKVLNQVNDGIIAFNTDGIINVFNHKCEETFKLRRSYVLGRNISQIIRNKDLLFFLMDKNAIGNQLFKINNVEIVINKFYIEKLDSIVCTLKNTKEMAEIESKLRRSLINKGHIAKHRFDDIVGNSKIIRNTIKTAKKLAKVDLSILINGESGTGKELFASAIHNESNRRTGPFLAVNFSSLSEDLVESELFGYVEGAFTGAKKGGKVGLFEQANNGTIFLDEIGDISLKLQARLLRVLQEKEIMKVGGTEITPINVRVLSATNKNLVKMCKEGKFREDLYYRLKKLYLETPPLRYRKDDIPDLVKHFLQKNHNPHIELTREVRELLINYEWFGNVRELENIIEYMLAVCEGQIISSDNLPQDFFTNHPVSKDTYSEFKDMLSNKGIIEEFIYILRIIDDYNKIGKGIGRKVISDLSTKNLYYLSEEQVRNRVNTLTQLGIIVKKRGRSGMHLTNKGKEFIDYTSFN